MRSCFVLIASPVLMSVMLVSPWMPWVAIWQRSSGQGKGRYRVSNVWFCVVVVVGRGGAKRKPPSGGSDKIPRPPRTSVKPTTHKCKTFFYSTNYHTTYQRTILNYTVPYTRTRNLSNNHHASHHLLTFGILEGLAVPLAFVGTTAAPTSSLKLVT